VTNGAAAHDVKTRSIVVLVVAGAAAIAAVGLWRASLPVGDAENAARNSAISVASASAVASPNPGSANAADPAAEAPAIVAPWRTPSTPSSSYAEPEEIERQLGQFFAEQSGLDLVSLSSIECGATACEIALTGNEVNPRYVNAYADVQRKLFETSRRDFWILNGSLGTREIAPGAREYVISFEYQPLVDLSVDPLIAARQYAACAAAWRRLTENPTPDDVVRDYLVRAERYVALAASVIGEQEATRIVAETRGGPVIRDCFFAGR
jgi:hypothetical protein